MKCKKFQELILLDHYDEINEASRKLLQKHLKQCPICAAEKAKIDDVSEMLNIREETEIDTEWLKSIRNQMIARLQVSKYRTKKFSPDWNRLFVSWKAPAIRVAYSTLLLVLGFSIGKFECQKSGSSILPEFRVGQMADLIEPMQPVNIVKMLQEGKLRNVDLQELPNQQVQVSFQGIKDYQLVGMPEDKGIQEVLAYIMLHEPNTGLRIKSLEKLSQQPDSLVLQLLIYSALNDENEGVRLKAIRSLHSYKPSNTLKKAYMKALMTDDNSAIRIEAMEGLQKMVYDEQVRDILTVAAAKDDNDYVKLLAKRALDEYQSKAITGTQIEKLR